jgi:glycine oxidase
MTLAATYQEFDVIIVGGGVIGLTLARELKKSGVERVSIVEKNVACGLEASGAAAGMLAPQAEADKPDDFFNFCTQSRNMYPRFAEELFNETAVDIELEQSGTLYLAFFERDLAALDNRYYWQQAANLQVESLTAKEILELEPNVSSNVLSGLRFANDWQVENRRLITALCRSNQNNKVQIFHNEIKNFIFGSGKILGVAGDQFKIYAPTVIVASGAWSSFISVPNDVKDRIKIEPIRGQIIALQAKNQVFRHVIHVINGYLVPRRDNRILVGATVENVGFNCQTGSAAINSLLEIKEMILPKIETNFSDHWFGFRPKTVDSLPLLGEFPENSGLFWATGHYRNGILLAPATGKFIADKIVRNIDSPFLQIFNPNRFVNNS